MRSGRSAIRCLAIAAMLFACVRSYAQCNQDYTFTASPLPVGGEYQSGQSVTFCYTVTDWNIVNVNWFQGLGLSFGAGWDLSTLVPGPPPPTCGASTGTWGWYDICDGTSGTAIGPVGPGYFFDLDNDGNPGNNFGDLCSGAVNWQFCFTISVASGTDCVDGADLSVTADSYGDSETGSWGSAGCGGDPVPTLPATTNCCSADAGSNGAVTLCTTSAPVDLATYLGGTPDAGGTWTAPGGGAAGSSLDPAVAVGGNYTYSVTSGSCTSSAVITVTINQPPNAGADGFVAVCSNNAATDLGTLILGEQPGGTWTDPGGAAFDGWYDPPVDVPGIYTYTVLGTAPCSADQSTVLVNETSPPNAGADGAITVCADGAPLDLFTSLTGPDAGGNWSAPGGAGTTSTYTPGTSLPGPYLYTVLGVAPCGSDQALVAVSQNNPVNAGTDGAITVCADGAVVDLFANLGGSAEAGGTWADPGGGAGGNTYTPGTSAPGAYTYTLTGIAPCTNDQATITVTQNDPVNAGADGATTVCADGAVIDLFPLIGAGPDAGGSWTDPGGVATTNTYTPGTSTPGIYIYTVTALAPCANDQAMVTVTQNNPVNVGADGVITVCADGSSVDLFAQLGGATAGGTWTAPGGGASTNTYTPGTSAPGVYTYTVTALAPCANDQATVTVTQNMPVSAGADGATSVCLDGADVDLFILVTGPDAGGTWTGPGGTATSSSYTPGTSSPGVYTYTVTALAPCANDQATVTVTQNNAVNSGVDGATSVCADGANVDLFTLLGGPEAGGSWTAPGGGATSSNYTPGTSAPGVYTYTVTALAPCADDQATITVTQNNPANAGADGATTVCANGANVDLFGLLGGPDAGGAWTAPGGGVTTSNYTPGTSAPGVYIYTVTAIAPCADDQATVTVSQNNPVNAGVDGATTICADGMDVDLFTLLGGPDAGGSWSAPGGGAATSGYTPGISAPGAYTYTVAALAPCADNQALVTVAQNNPVNAGTDGATTVCADGAGVDLLTLLGAPDAGGTWTAPGGGATPSSYTPGTSAPGVYTYTVTALTPCADDQATVTVTQNNPVNAGVDGTATVCADGANVDLFTFLAAPDAGGSWTAPGGGATSNSYDPGTSAPGVYTYTVTAPAACANDQATVSVTQNNPPDAGTDGDVTLCITSPAVDLFSALGGTPDAGGIWTSPGGGASNGTFTPGTNTVGTYTYTVPGAAPCADAGATVTVAVVSLPDPGSDGTITLCTSGPVTDLFGALGGTPDAGGTWTSPGGAAHPGTLDPANDVAGAYTYTIDVPPPCVSVSSTVSVALQAPPDPGLDGAELLCVTSAAMDLFGSLQGSPDAGGSWTAPGGGAFSGSFVPGTSTPGLYTYTVAGTAPCPNASASVDVAVTSIPDAGADGSTTLCSSGAPQDLFATLGGSPDVGGTWAAPGGGAHSGTIDPATDPAGDYTYTIAAPAPCPSVSSTVTVDLLSPPDAGADGSELLCVTSPAIDLLGSLLGTPDAGGSWTAPGGGAFNGPFIPGTSTPGIYTYTVPGTAPCPAASAVVDVTVMDIPDPGTAGNITVCTSGVTEDLFSVLGGSPDAGGTWTAPGGGAHTGTLDPASDAAGIYTYTINVPPPCASVSSTVTVALQAPPDPGSDGTELLCVSSPPTDLFGSLLGSPDANGSWTAPGGGAFNGIFLPGTSDPGIYTYTVQGTAPCPLASAIVDVQVISYPDPGINGLLALCATYAPSSLFPSLGGTPDIGGTWTAPDGSAHADVFDPAIDAAGIYSYTIAVPAPCSSVSATVTVSLQQPPIAGADGALSLCISGSGTALFDALNGAPDAGGSWSDLLGEATDGTFVPGSDAPGIYTYTVAGTAPCASASALVDVAVNDEPDAGVNGAIALCTGGAPVELFSNIGGTPDAGGSWTGPGGGANSGTFEPSLDAAGVYTYTITVPPPCSNASSTVTVVVQPGPDPGADGTITLCSTDGPVLLLPSLGGTPDLSGTWSSPSGNVSDGTFDPTTGETGAYTYTLNGIAPCAAATAQVIVSVNQLPDAGSHGLITLCSIDAAITLLGELGGSPDASGSWTAPGGSAHSGTFDPAIDGAGVYIYTVSGTVPCPSDASSVVVSVETPPDAGSDGALSLCTTGSVEDLFAALNGSPDANGSWSAPGGSASVGTLDPAFAQAGPYVYTVAGTAPCPAVTATVDVSITPAANAGSDGAILLCSASPAIDLFDHLNGAPQAGGSWTAPGGGTSGGAFDPSGDTPGLFTYTVTGNAPCPNASASVLVNVTSDPDAGLPGDATLCISDAPTELLDLLTGTPDAGGAWTTPAGAPHSGTLDPAVDAAGTYSYLIDVPPPCVSASSSVTITLVAPADPGIDGALSLCATSAPVDLFAQLGGTPALNGTWSVNGQPHGNTFDPSTDPSGDYFYTLVSDAPCPAVSSVVAMTVNDPPDPGSDGATVLCASGDLVDLSSFLGGDPEPGGAWTINGSPHAGSIDPGADVAGDYVYTLDGIAPCPSASSTVSVAIEMEPDPGTDGLRPLCLSDGPNDLFGELGGTPDLGGTWSGPSPVTDGQFDPGTMTAGDYTYFIEVPAPCISVSSLVTILTVQPPDPGSNGSALLCASSPATDLFDVLEGTPEAGGGWTDPLGIAHGPLFNPAADAPGEYTYTVNGIAPCPSAQAVVVMNVVSEPDAGGNGALTLCQSDDIADLFNWIEGSPDAGGTWSGPTALPEGLFDPSTMLPGEYTYLLDAPEPCVDASSTVLVSVSIPPDPGTDGSASLCTTSDAIDLFTLLTGSPEPDGTWTAPGGAPHTSLFNPAQDPAGVYTYTVPGDAPCASASAAVIISLSQPPDAGTDGSITLCPDAGEVDLFTLLGGSPDAGGAWTAPGGGTHDGSMDPSIDPEGTYTYGLEGVPPCGHDVSVVIVEVSDPVIVSTTTTDAICHDACDGTATLTILGGTPDYAMQWSGNVAGSSAMQATGLCAGSYGITITDANGCLGTVNFTIGEPPPLVIDAIGIGDENCIGSCDGYLNIVDGAGVLFSIDGGDTWVEETVIGELCAGGYLVMMQDANGCLASAPAIVASPPPVTAGFYGAPDTMSVSNTTVAFTNQSGYAETFVWDFGGLATSTEGNPTFTFPDVLGGVYTVCLTATDGNGCADSICQPIVVLDELFVTVPNAFSPNGDDINDGFAPVFNVPAFADEYEFMIFDRWGLRIFTSETIGEQWDGGLNGEIVQQDVYVWKMHCKDKITREEYDLVGHVTVVK